jgi:hypothetical protein
LNIPIPPQLATTIDASDFQFYLWVGGCSFCGLSFELVWVGKLASCKYLYHPWCAIVHFSTSTKCGDPLCAKEMHNSWWLCSGIKKPWPTYAKIRGQKHINIYGVVNKLGAFYSHQLVHYNRKFSMSNDSSFYLSLDGDWIEVAFKLSQFLVKFGSLKCIIINVKVRWLCCCQCVQCVDNVFVAMLCPYTYIYLHFACTDVL